MVESGYDYSADCLPDAAVWEQMLSKSPIKYIAKVSLIESLSPPSLMHCF